ncbi:MAG: thioredoxin domain-containing protein [Bryobacterales bacterium]|nr:thioredoxin domain-containing protein [Bryobacterales bacterium]
MPTNRLIHEKSPYLLQHAHNPVDWYPWGTEAFEKARREDKPIFLSIGYSTCHWCHVMERESFENEEIASLLNSHFVAIKVDREERPDVDRVYMLFVQASTGGGGWPMSVWLTPELKPFFGGTYFPPATRYGRPGFREVLTELAKAWALERDSLINSSNQVLAELEKYVRAEDSSSGWLNETPLEAAYNAYRRMFDTRFGGFGSAPKFPRPVVHNFLLRYSRRNPHSEALEMVLQTLRAMARGGMHDQLGGGFHRYSVDERWFVPHFEKMLYDQAQLATSYLEAYQLTGDEALGATARDIFEYVLRDLTGPEKAFYSAEDADSAIDASRPEEKGEGAFYLWTREQINATLGQPAADWFAYRYGVETGGNVANDPHGEFSGRNILFESHTIGETAAHFSIPVVELARALEDARASLLALRGERLRPHRDDKILTGWNGLMISAFTLGARALGESRYLSAAQNAAEFILSRMRDQSTGSLLRRYRDQQAAIPAFLDDYALFVQGLLDLYESSFELRYLETAAALTQKQIELFEDRDHGGFYSTDAAAGSPLVLRIKDDDDGAEPSGNSTAALNLLRLARITGREEYRATAERTLAAFGRKLANDGSGMPQMLVALMFFLAKLREIVISGSRGEPRVASLLNVAWRRFLPDSVLLLADEAGRSSPLLPGAADKHPVNGAPAAYVCHNFTCQLPVTNVDTLLELLK